MNSKRLFLFCVGLFTLICAASAHARVLDKTAALVNSDVVLNSDVLRFEKNRALRHELDPYISLTSFKSEKPADIINYLIQENLVLQKFPPTKDEVEEEISAVQRNNKIDRDGLKGVLKSQGVRFDDYEGLMRVSISKRKLIDRELRPLSVITDDEIKNYYYTNPAFLERKKNERLVLSYTLQQILIPNRLLADAAAKRLRAGDDFDAVGADLAAQGVEKSTLGTFQEDKLNASIQKAISGLKVGNSSEPISTGDGYMILKISAIGAPKDPVFEKEKESIRNQLFQKALLNQLTLWTEKERAQSYVYIP